MPGHTVRRVWQSNPVLDAPAKYRKACEYDAFIPDPLTRLELALPLELANLVTEAESSIRTLNTGAEQALRPLARLLLRTESIASSKVEGMQMGVRELARAEAKMETGGKGSQTAVDILDNVNAMELAIAEAARTNQFDQASILTIHGRLMAHDQRKQMVGRFRTEQNWIGGNDYNPCGADFVPPPPEEVPGLLEDLSMAINGDVLPPIVQAALVHAQFETIHPFDDGNGRTGRALIHVVLKRRGVAPAYVPPISVILAAAKDRYIEGLTKFRRGTEGVLVWIEQFASSAARSAALARKYVGEVQALQGTWREQVRAAAAPRADAAAWSVIDVLPAHPVITAPVAAAATGRSRAPVYEAIAQLEAAGVLIPLSQSRRNRSWEAAGLLDLVAGLEAGRMPA
jgi:Fic family protein